jgi:hypothetical protein
MNLDIAISMIIQVITYPNTEDSTGAAVHELPLVTGAKK